MGGGGPKFGKNSQKIPYFFSDRLPYGVNLCYVVNLFYGLTSDGVIVVLLFNIHVGLQDLQDIGGAVNIFFYFPSDGLFPPLNLVAS